METYSICADLRPSHVVKQVSWQKSSPELMCNSVLPGRLAKEASKYDPQEEDGTDVGKVLIGQNSSLVWTREGLKFQFPKKSKEEAEAESTHREGDVWVSMEWKLGEEFLRLGYFREELSKILNEATSVMQVPRWHL